MTLTGNYRRLERIIKGVSNHRRIQILELLDRYPELSVNEISGNTGTNFKTASEHVRRMATAGLVMKRSDGKSVRHKITPRGLNALKFLRMLE